MQAPCCRYVYRDGSHTVGAHCYYTVLRLWNHTVVGHCYRADRGEGDAYCFRLSALACLSVVACTVAALRCCTVEQSPHPTVHPCSSCARALVPFPAFLWRCCRRLSALACWRAMATGPHLREPPTCLPPKSFFLPSILGPMPSRTRRCGSCGQVFASPSAWAKHFDRGVCRPVTHYAMVGLIPTGKGWELREQMYRGKANERR